MFKKSENEIHAMSVEAASDYTRRMVQREARGPGDIENALRRLEQRYGIGFWQLWHLRTGRAKSVDTSLYARIRAAYLDMCQQQVSALQHEIAIEEAKGNDDLADLEAEAARLASEIAAKKAALNAVPANDFTDARHPTRR